MEKLAALSLAEVRLLLPRDCFYITCNGRIVNDWDQLREGQDFQLHARLLGGKGGFGSLLRSFRIHRSSNQLMCRDLSGRRLCDVKEEERLKKWIEKGADREKEKELKRKEKYERLKKGPPKHDFEDQEYIQQREEILDRTEEAFQQALRSKKSETAACSSGIGQKRKHADVDSQHVVPETKTMKVDEREQKKNHDNSPIKPAQDEQQAAPPPKLTKQQKKELYEAEKKRKAEMESAAFDPIDLNAYDSIESLEVLGLDRLRQELERRGLKCGGSLNERSSRLFSVKGLQPNQYPKASLAAPAAVSTVTAPPEEKKKKKSKKDKKL